MSKPVHIISPQMSLEAIMRNMCRFRVRALPVADQNGKVLGLITEANIFKAILQTKGTHNISVSEEGNQAQSVSPHVVERTKTKSTKTKKSSLVSA
jgi:predicted transcriptional regulator